MLTDRDICMAAYTQGRALATIPISAFLEDGRTSSIVRLCHCKPPQVLAEGVRRLAVFRDGLA